MRPLLLITLDHSARLDSTTALITPTTGKRNFGFFLIQNTSGEAKGRGQSPNLRPRAEPQLPGLHVDDTSISIQHAFMHHFAQRWMREYRIHQVFFCGFQLATNDISLNQLGDFRAHHVGT